MRFRGQRRDKRKIGIINKIDPFNLRLLDGIISPRPIMVSVFNLKGSSS